MKEIIELHHKLLHTESPFRHMAIAALFMGAGSLIATIVDLGWVIGDMLHDFRIYHALVGIGLTTASALMTFSFFYVYRSVLTYLRHHESYITNKKAKAGLRRVK